MNRIISDNLDTRSFITMTYAVLDLEAGSMVFARAGHTPLTTQVYFAGDQWLEHDVVGAARPSLVTKLERADGPDGAAYTCQFDFTLAPH